MMQSAKTIRLKNMRGRVMNAEVVYLRLVTALCCFAVVSVRHDAVAQYASELGKARQVSQHGVTWKFDKDDPFYLWSGQCEERWAFSRRPKYRIDLSAPDSSHDIP
jgi:hypothetical protein